MKFILHTTLWGEHHTEVFLHYTLPSLLGDTSIDKYNKKYSFQFNLFTTKKDYKKIEETKIFNMLKKKLNVIINTNLIDEKLKIKDQLDSIRDAGGTLFQGHVRINNMCIKKTMDEVINDQNSAFCWFKPDTIFSNTYFSTIVKAHENGKRMVWAPSENRSCIEILDYLKKYKDTDETIKIDPISLSTASFKYIVKRYAYKNYFNYYNPSRDWGFFYTTAEGFIKHAPSPNPIYLWPLNKDIKFEFYDDERFNDWTATDFLEKSTPDLKDIHIVTDTAEIVSVDIGQENVDENIINIFNKKNKSILFRPSKIKFIKLILKENLGKHCNYYFGTPVLHRVNNDDKSFKLESLKNSKPQSSFIREAIDYADAIRNKKLHIYSIFLLANLIHLGHRLKRKLTPWIRISGGEH